MHLIQCSSCLHDDHWKGNFTDGIVIIFFPSVSFFRAPQSVMFFFKSFVIVRFASPLIYHPSSFHLFNVALASLAFLLLYSSSFELSSSSSSLLLFAWLRIDLPVTTRLLGGQENCVSMTWCWRPTPFAFVQMPQAVKSQSRSSALSCNGPCSRRTREVCIVCPGHTQDITAGSWIPSWEHWGGRGTANSFSHFVETGCL